MSILEDLDLMDLLDELPEDSDFDLNDILFEFSTPGLFAAPVEEAPEETFPEVAAEQVEETTIEEPEAIICEAAEEPEKIVCEIVEEQDEIAVDIEPAVIEEASEEDIQIAPISDDIEPEEDDVVIFTKEDFATETFAEDSGNARDAEVYFGDSLGICDILYEFGTPTDEEGVKLYSPATKGEAPGKNDPTEVTETVVFTAVDMVEEPSVSKPVAEPKPTSLFAKVSAAVMSLFAKKKTTKEAPIASVKSVEEMDMMSLFTEDSPVAEETASVVELEETAEECIPVVESEETAEESIPVVESEETAEESIPVVESEEEDFSIGDILFELSNVGEDGSEVEPVYDFNITDTDEDVKVFTPVETAVPEIDIVPESTAEDAATILFDALDLAVEPEPVPVQTTVSVPVQPKKVGLFTKAAALVMGLFASKKSKKNTVTSADTFVPSIVSAEDEVLANLTDLFANENSDELSDMDELMLELELQVEREAELEAEAAAREAAERLAREEQQKALELEAQRLAQEEADAMAAAKRQLEAEQARIKSETDALLDQLYSENEEQQALAEEELFEWLEAAEKRRHPIAEAVPETNTVTLNLDDTIRFDVPLMEQPGAESTAPVYDYTAMDLSMDSAEGTAPQLEINIEETSSETVDDLLEMPNVDQISPLSEETPEEAAARKKKEDDELRYVPEESTAKAISSHIGKRFGAAFAAFTNAADDGDREEDLGPELAANKAYRFFHKYINAYRFRLRISAVLCVILGWISLGLPVFGSLKNPAVAAAMCLMMLLTVMLAGADILATGIRTLLNRRPGIHSLVSLSCVASIIDAVAIIMTKGTAGYLPFCAVSAISMCFAIYGSLLYCRSQRLNFKTLDRATEPMTISVDYGIVEEDTSTAYRTPGHPEGYIHHSEEEDLSETVYGLMAPILIPAIPVMTVIAALFSNGFGDFFHIMAAMFGAAASFSALIAFPLPYFLVQRDLYATKAAIAGWAGAREIGRVTNMIVSDRDLFPDDTVSIKSVRIVDNVPPQLTLSYMCSLIRRSGSCLVPAFNQLAENNDCDFMDVENFQCHEAGGLSGEIGPDSVLVASHSYMKLQGFRIPARKKDSENALFLAVNGHVIAYIIVDYKPIKSVRAGLESALRGNVEMIFAARDFNVTPLLIAKKFKSATETLRFPSYSQRYEMTSHTDSETATCAAVVYRKSFYSYAVVVEKARYLYRSVSLAVVLSAVSSLLGILLMFFMAIGGAGAAVTVSRLLVFMLLWLIPTLALTVSMTR